MASPRRRGDRHQTRVLNGPHRVVAGDRHTEDLMIRIAFERQLPLVLTHRSDSHTSAVCRDVIIPASESPKAFYEHEVTYHTELRVDEEFAVRG